MQSERSARRSAYSNAAIRHLRDLLRSEILRGSYPDGLLHSETEMISTYGVSRATVRAALSLLREEGIIVRVQGVGTLVVAKPVQAHLIGTNFTTAVTTDLGESNRAEPRPRILDRSVVMTPSSIADRLGVDAETPCVRLEFVALKQERPAAVVTNYILFPEAERLLATPFISEWQSYLADAGIAMGDADYLIGCLGADAAVAALLEVDPGSPVTLIEQLTHDPSGRPFNFAVMYFRGDRTMFHYRVSPSGQARQNIEAP